MAKLLGAVSLALLGLAMLLGFLRAEPDAGPLAIALAFAIVVVLPLGAGSWLAYAWLAERRGRRARRQRLRRQTLESELVRLARLHHGKLTVVEAVAATGLDAATVEGALQSLHNQGLVEIELGDSGTLVYAFPDVQHLEEKATARRVLDA
ncbi:MAG: hypothetical protein D6696_13085 [Acidobacteria bacterium]|nr:MAG: hypothetical protein D6696_13085 [Acidobacteriota bacterium]